MSWDVQAPRVTDITSKWELARRISDHKTSPKVILQSIFADVLLHLEEKSGIAFEISLKTKVWKDISEEKLKILEEFFLFEFCEQILGEFDENQTIEMIEDHKENGCVEIYSEQIQIAFSQSKKQIIDALIKKAESMEDAWTIEIVEAVRREVFPPAPEI